MTLCKMGGSQKKNKFWMYYYKWHFIRGGWSIKTTVIFQNVFQLICQFFSSSCYILSLIFIIIASFFPIFDTNSHFIIDCCVNGKVWSQEICKKCGVMMWNGFGRFRIYICFGFCHYFLCHCPYGRWVSQRNDQCHFLCKFFFEVFPYGIQML